MPSRALRNQTCTAHPSLSSVIGLGLMLGLSRERKDRVMTEIRTFPAALRELIEAELRVGNRIVEVSNTSPAPPAGACVLLENRVTTRPRKTAELVKFFERKSPSHSGEFTDADRLYFVLEPPIPPPPAPDMDAIRREMEAKERAANAAYDTWLR